MSWSFTSSLLASRSPFAPICPPRPQNLLTLGPIYRQHLNTTATRALDAGEPVISVDTKKKELVGDFKNGGRELRPTGEPEPVRVHDFEIPELGKVAPYGVYDIDGGRPHRCHQALA